MIEASNRQQLAEVMASLKRANEPYYRQLCQAFSTCIDPEHKLLVTVPADKILHQQGRTAMGIDLLEVLYQCEEIAAQRQRADAGLGPGMPASLIGGGVGGGVFNGR